MDIGNDSSIGETCLVFPFSKVNANAISALLGSLDTHPFLQNLEVKLPEFKEEAIKVLETLKDYNSIILAFSVYTTQLEEVRDKIKEYRETLSGKRLIVIAGGPHPMGDPFSMLINGPDIVCVTEGELVIREILLRFIANNDIYESPGIAYLDTDGRVIKTNKPELIDLDDFPPFSIKHKLIRPIELTRGCAWNCRFCQIRSRGLGLVRHRSVKQVLKYVTATVEHFHKRRPDIRFVSPNALSYGSNDGKSLRLEKVEELLSGIKKIIGPTGKIYFGSFPSEVRPETITNQSVGILKKYTNVEKIIVGGQSGSNAILNSSDRGHTAEETERAVKLLIDHGFKVDVDIIFGLPGETEQDVKYTISHMHKLTNMGATIHSHTFLPLVGTPFASKPAGMIDQLYLPIITNLQKKRSISGYHVKQEREAKIIADRRVLEKELKRNRITSISVDESDTSSNQ